MYLNAEKLREDFHKSKQLDFYNNPISYFMWLEEKFLELEKTCAEPPVIGQSEQLMCRHCGLQPQKVGMFICSDCYREKFPAH
jgi:hypothetical protein